MLEIQEPVNVWVLFKRNAIQSFAFFWKNRQIRIDKVNLVHTSKTGSSVFYHFSVSAGNNFYRLKFSIQDLKWVLEQVEEG